MWNWSGLPFYPYLFKIHFIVLLRLKAGNPKDKKVVAVYVQNAKKRMIHQACAQVWALGVPWAEAFNLCQQAIDAADAVARPIAKGRAKGKGKGRGRGKGRGKGKGRVATGGGKA